MGDKALNKFKRSRERTSSLLLLQITQKPCHNLLTISYYNEINSFFLKPTSFAKISRSSFISVYKNHLKTVVKKFPSHKKV